VVPGVQDRVLLLTGKAAGKHGKAPTVTVGDEMHEWASRDLADTLRQGESSLEPIRLYASTAGLKQQGPATSSGRKASRSSTAACRTRPSWS
jgi:hypothetical protein